MCSRSARNTEIDATLTIVPLIPIGYNLILKWKTLGLLLNFMDSFWLHLIVAKNGGKGNNMPWKKS